MGAFIQPGTNANAGVYVTPRSSYGVANGSPVVARYGSVSPKAREQNQPEERNFLREGLWRYWGYLNEAAESLKSPIESFCQSVGLGKSFGTALVKPWSYNIVYVYALLDGLLSGKRAFGSKEERSKSLGERTFDAVDKGVDALLFQTSASVYVPAFIVSAAREGAEAALNPHHVAPAAAPAKNIFAKAEKTLLQVLDYIIGEPVRSRSQILIEELLKRSEGLPALAKALRSPLAKTLIPIALSFPLIFVVLKPIDAITDKILDCTYRPIMRGLKKLLFPQARLVQEDLSNARESRPAPSVSLHPAFGAFTGGPIRQ